MLEQRIENLENQVAKLTTAIENLTEVLTSGTTPPPVAQVKAAPVEEAPKKENKPKAASKPASKPKQPKVEEVQKALVDLTHAYGRKAALSVLNSFDGANKVGDLDKDQYAEVIVAAANYKQQEAA